MAASRPRKCAVNRWHHNARTPDLQHVGSIIQSFMRVGWRQFNRGKRKWTRKGKTRICESSFHPTFCDILTVTRIHSYFWSCCFWSWLVTLWPIGNFFTFHFITENWYCKSTHVDFQVFAGNRNRRAKVYSQFPQVLQCRYIRIYPQTWRRHISMRVEIVHGSCFNSENLPWVARNKLYQLAYRHE